MNTISSIDGVALPIQPQHNGYNVTTSDLDGDSTGRSAETGVLLRYVIRKGVYKIELSFRGTASNIRKIKDMIAPTRLSVTFWDIDKWVTADMYVGDRTQKLLPVIGQENMYDFSFSLVEY